jgi:hypothetical protein
MGYRASRKARVVLELFNIFNADVSDIDYYYASRLTGESARHRGRAHPSSASAFGSIGPAAVVLNS